MVTTINDLQRRNKNGQHKGMVVELVGPAGVGKSTLFRALRQKELPWLLCQYVPPVWSISYAPFYIINILMLIPYLVRLIGNGDRLLNRRELAFMAILNGWHEILRKEVANSNKIIVLDQGPISIMAYLRVWGPQSLFYSNMQAWWEKVYGKWMEALSMVVMLDTSDEKVIWRINNRPQGHHLKGESNNIVLEWLYRYRVLYEQIVGRLSPNSHGIRVVRIDSGNNSVDEIMEKVFHEFHFTGGEVNQ